MGTKIYFFKGDKYARYDRGEDRFDQEPLEIRKDKKWIGLHETGFAHKVDAAIRWNNGFIYFFQGDEYIRFRIKDNSVDLARRKIREGWPGMHETGFAHKVGAAINYDNGKAYFFQDKDYVRYDLVKDSVDLEHTRIPIEKEWNGLKTAENEDRDFTKNIDAAIQYGNGKVYFFKGDKYVRYDIEDDKLDAGPFFIREKWPGLSDPSLFLNNLDAVVDEFDETTDLFLPGATIRRAPDNQSGKYLPSSWRGVLHATQGTTLQGAFTEFDTKKSWPHLTIEPNTRKIVQHYPLNKFARSLKSSRPDAAHPNRPLIETNKLHCIQIEIVGDPAKFKDLSQDHLNFISSVMREVENLVPIPRQSGLKFLETQNLVNTNPDNRMKKETWKRFSGWCGHQHVPANDHWDPGGINIVSILFLMGKI